MHQTVVRTLVVEFLPEQSCIVTYQGTDPPSDADWDAYVGQTRALTHVHLKLRVLAYSEGGRPSKDQQARLVAVVRDLRTRVAIVSPALAMRFVVSVFALTNPNVRCFTPGQLSEAFKHLGLHPAGQLAVEQALERMRSRVHPVEAAATNHVG